MDGYRSTQQYLTAITHLYLYKLPGLYRRQLIGMAQLKSKILLAQLLPSLNDKIGNMFHLSNLGYFSFTAARRPKGDLHFKLQKYEKKSYLCKFKQRKPMELPSNTLANAVENLSNLPGVGKRSALRFALHLLKQPPEEVQQLATAIHRLTTDIHYCHLCHCLSDSDTCPICASPKRTQSIICVVENVQDVMAIENTQQYRGLYHVLGGVISPIDGIGIRDLHIDTLLTRVQQGLPAPVEEVILALPTTMEGDTTAFYLNKQLAPLGVKVTTIARGIAVGDNLEYADEITLGRSILNRIPFA